MAINSTRVDVFLNLLTISQIRNHCNHKAVEMSVDDHSSTGLHV